MEKEKITSYVESFLWEEIDAKIEQIAKSLPYSDYCDGFLDGLVEAKKIINAAKYKLRNQEAKL